MSDWTLILTHNRHELLSRVAAAAAEQCDFVLVIDNASEPPVTVSNPRYQISLMRDDEQPPNLARMWNRGLDWIDDFERSHAQSDRWNVALIGDDVILPTGWYAAVRDALRSNDAAAASAYSYQEGIPAEPYVLRTYSNGIERMCPWAFMLPGERHLRADERFRWWYCDTDIDWQARGAGGVAIIPGPVADNLLPSDWTNRKPELQVQAIIDGQNFSAKWGSR